MRHLPAESAPDAATPQPRGATAGWWRWPLLTLLVGATLLCTGAYWVWFLTVDLATVEAAFSIPLSAVVDAALSLNGLVWMVPGLVVLRRARWHPVGWMLVATGLGYALSFDMGEREVWEVIGVPDHWAAWVADGWGNSVAFSFTAGLLNVFPNGLPREPRLRRWAIIRLGLAGAGLLLSALGETVGGHRDATFSSTSYPNPTGLGFIPVEVAGWMFLFILGSMVGSAVALWRRSRGVEPSRRSQYTWVLFPISAMIASVVLGIVLSGFLGDSVWLGVVFMYFLVPIAFSIAIVRHRLLDIDRVVNRTVTYAATAAVIVVVYAAPVVVLPEVLGLSSDLSVAVATLSAAALVAPLRRRVQSLVARRFDRARYDAERVLAAVAARLQSIGDSAAVSAEVGSAVAAALRPRSVGVWLRATGTVTMPERPGGTLQP